MTRWAIASRPALLACGLALASCRASSPAPSNVLPPLPSGSCLVVGFLGGLDARYDATKGVRRLALDLHDRDNGIFVETFENRRAGRAVVFVREALDRDHDDRIEPDETAGMRLVVYGQSLGGWAVVSFARALHRFDLPIDLTIQIDSVGRDDELLPPNVRHAANLFQDEGLFIAGEPQIAALDPSRTVVLGNWEFDYDSSPGNRISVADLGWPKTIFRADHARMDRDPRVWGLVGELIEAACAGDAELRSLALR